MKNVTAEKKENQCSPNHFVPSCLQSAAYYIRSLAAAVKAESDTERAQKYRFLENYFKVSGGCLPQRGEGRNFSSLSL